MLECVLNMIMDWVRIAVNYHKFDLRRFQRRLVVCNNELEDCVMEEIDGLWWISYWRFARVVNNLVCHLSSGGGEGGMIAVFQFWSCHCVQFSTGELDIRTLFINYWYRVVKSNFLFIYLKNLALIFGTFCNNDSSGNKCIAKSYTLTVHSQNSQWSDNFHDVSEGIAMYMYQNYLEL